MCRWRKRDREALHLILRMILTWASVVVLFLLPFALLSGFALPQSHGNLGLSDKVKTKLDINCPFFFGDTYISDFLERRLMDATFFV